MWTAAFRISCVWAALAAFYMLSRFWSLPGEMRPVNSSDWAAWVGAIGTVGAALWAAWTYWRDQSRKAEADRRARQLSAWRQALLLLPELGLAAQKLRAIVTHLMHFKPDNDPHGTFVTTVPEDWLLVTETMGVLGKLNDPMAFELPMAGDLLRFVAAVHIHNEVVKYQFTRQNVPPGKAGPVKWHPDAVRTWHQMKRHAERLDKAVKDFDLAMVRAYPHLGTPEDVGQNGS